MVSLTPRVRDHLKYGAVPNIANTHMLSGLPYDPAGVSEETLLLLVLIQVGTTYELRDDSFIGKVLHHLQSPDAPIARILKKRQELFGS